MNIIAVNIRRTQHLGILQATQRAWKLKKARAQTCNYVIGVSGGRILGSFALQRVQTDTREPNRLFFDLTHCTPREVQSINNVTNRTNLSGFTVKYL